MCLPGVTARAPPHPSKHWTTCASTVLDCRGSHSAPLRLGCSIAKGPCHRSLGKADTEILKGGIAKQSGKVKTAEAESGKKEGGSQGTHCRLPSKAAEGGVGKVTTEAEGGKKEGGSKAETTGGGKSLRREFQSLRKESAAKTLSSQGKRKRTTAGTQTRKELSDDCGQGIRSARHIWRTSTRK